MDNDDDDIEKQYQPSRWCRRFKPDEVVSMHVKIATEESNKARSTIPFKNDVKYGNRKGQSFDIYGDGTLKNGSPIFVYIHGGYWQSIDKNISAYSVNPLFEEGIKVIVPDYDLAPEVSMSIIVEEIFDLATYVLKMAKEDEVREVWFGGHSAGSHLSSMLLSPNWLSKLEDDLRAIFKGLFLVSGIYNLRPLLSTTVNDALNLTEKEVNEFSSMFSIDSQVKSCICENFSVIIGVGENDSPAFQRQSHDFYEVLRKNGVSSEYILVEEVDHFNIVENLSKADFKLTKELIDRLTKT